MKTKLQENQFYVASTNLMKRMIDELDGDGTFAIEEAKLCVAKLKEYHDYHVSLPHKNEEGVAVMHGCRLMANRTVRYWEARLQAVRYDVGRNSATDKIYDEWREWRHANKKEQAL